jgi:hypothetical protein
VNDVFEINEEDVLTLLYKAINLLQLYDIQDSMKFERGIITRAIQNFQNDVIAIKGADDYLSEEECEALMDKVYKVIKNVIDLVEINFFD